MPATEFGTSPRYEKAYGNDLAEFKSMFYPLETEIAPFGMIRDTLDLYAGDTNPEEYVEPTSGKTIKVDRNLSGEIQPVDSIYTTFFDQKVGNHTLIGMNCYVPDWRIPGHASEKAHVAKLDELFSGLEKDLAA
jgi:hypothetical protein